MNKLVNIEKDEGKLTVKKQFRITSSTVWEGTVTLLARQEQGATQAAHLEIRLSMFLPALSTAREDPSSPK